MLVAGRVEVVSGGELVEAEGPRLQGGVAGSARRLAIVGGRRRVLASSGNLGCSVTAHDARDREDPFSKGRSAEYVGVVVRAELQVTEAGFEITGEFLSLVLGVLGGGLVGGRAQNPKSST